MRRPAAAAAAAAALVAAMVVLSGPVASAHEDVGAHGFVALSADGDLTSSPTVSGRFEVSVLEYVDNVALTLTPSGPTPGTSLSVNGCTLATSGKCGESRVDFAWSLPDLPYNGPYVANATARHCLTLCVAAPTTARVNPVSFRLAAPPRKPDSVRADVNGDGTVTLSWARNPEPDMIGYALLRKAPGAATFAQVGPPVPQPKSSATRATFQDTTTAAAGGTFSYQVVAVRNGASGDSGTAVASPTSSAATALIPVVTTTPSTVMGGPAAGGPTTVVKGPTGAASLNLGSFLAKGTPAPRPTPVPTLPEVDNGFNPELPFGPGEQAPPADGGTEAALPAGSRGIGGGSGAPRGALIPVAVGSMLLVLAMHARFLSRRLAGPAAIAVSAADADAAVVPVDALASGVIAGPERPFERETGPERPFERETAPERPFERATGPSDSEPGFEVGIGAVPAPPADWDEGAWDDPGIEADGPGGDDWAVADWGGSELPVIDDQVPPGGSGAGLGYDEESSEAVEEVGRAVAGPILAGAAGSRTRPAADPEIQPQARAWPRVGDPVAGWAGGQPADGWGDDEGLSKRAGRSAVGTSAAPESDSEDDAVWEVVSPTL